MRARPVFTALVLAASLGSFAQAAAPHSTYSETRKCPVVAERPDEFIRECSGPGGVTAILHYVEGKLGIFYMPVMKDKDVPLEHMIELSTSASYPYGAKLEWRVNGKTACAAVLRTYLPAGERLVVHDLSNGERLGLVRTNKEAQTLADRACSQRPALTPVVANAASTQTPPAMPAPEGAQSLQEALSKGTERFDKTYIQTGISGVQDDVTECYAALKPQGPLDALAECAALDLRAQMVDRAMTRNMPDLAQPFFSERQVHGRILAAAAQLAGGQAAASALFAEIGLEANMSGSQPENPAPRGEDQAQAASSVFDFSK